MKFTEFGGTPIATAYFGGGDCEILWGEEVEGKDPEPLKKFFRKLPQGSVEVPVYDPIFLHPEFLHLISCLQGT